MMANNNQKKNRKKRLDVLLVGIVMVTAFSVLMIKITDIPVCEAASVINIIGFEQCDNSNGESIFLSSNNFHNNNTIEQYALLFSEWIHNAFYDVTHSLQQSLQSVG